MPKHITRRDKEIFRKLWHLHKLKNKKDKEASIPYLVTTYKELENVLGIKYDCIRKVLIKLQKLGDLEKEWDLTYPKETISRDQIFIIFKISFKEFKKKYDSGKSTNRKSKQHTFN